MNIRTKLEVLAAGIVGLGLVWGYLHWRNAQREIGAAQVEAADARALVIFKEREAVQLLHEKQANEDAVNALQNERDKLMADLAAVPAPVIRVCNNASDSGRLPAPAGAAPGAREGAAAPGDVRPVREGAGERDIGPVLLELATVAERVSGMCRAMQQRELTLR